MREASPRSSWAAAYGARLARCNPTPATMRLCGRHRSAPAVAHRDDRAVNSSLDLQEVIEPLRTRSPRARHRRLLRLPLRRARRRARVAGDARHACRGADPDAADAPGEGITGVAAAERTPVMIAVAGAPRSHASSSSRICRRTTTSRSSPCRSSRGKRSRERSTCAPGSRAPSPRARSSCSSRSHPRSPRRSSTRSCTRRPSGACRARGAGAYLRGGLRVPLPRGVARGDREDDDGVARMRPGAALVLEDGKIAWPEGRAGAYAVRLPLALEAPADRRARLRPRHAVLARRRAPCSRRSRTMRPLRSSTGEPSCAACSLRRSITASRTTCRSVASLLRLQARAENVDPRKSLETPSTASSPSPPCTRC